MKDKTRLPSESEIASQCVRETRTHRVGTKVFIVESVFPECPRERLDDILVRLMRQEDNATA